MKLTRFAILTFSCLFSFSTFTSAHSTMFDDNYTFDDTNEGPSAALLMLFNEDFNLAAANLCTNGTANGYPCSNVDLMSFLPKADMGGGTQNLNDIWGWTDPVNGNEIAIVGRTHGTAFVDVTDPENPVHLGFLPSHNNGSDSWRDMKVYGDHAFIVADGGGNSGHGLQVFDLTTLRTVTPGGTLSETNHLGGFGAAHNIAINEDSGFAYIVGSNQCSGGLYMVDVSTPANPTFAGCFSSDGYTHDVQCVNYNGPDVAYANKEICVAYNEDTITVVDVTNKSAPSQISRTGYTGSQYTHQGWFVDGTHTTVVMNDELDEQRNGQNTTSYIYDMTDLDNPVELGRYTGPTAAIDHNLYSVNGLVFETNYRAGLRILNTDNVTSGQLTEVAYFDTIAGSDSAQFSGTWSNYPYFASGNVILSDIGNGLFVVAPDYDAIANPPPPPPAEYCTASGNNASEEWISNVEIGAFTNPSGSSQYTDFTNLIMTANRGDNNVTLTPAFGGQSYNEWWKIWIDLDADSVFDANELVYDSGSASSSSVSGTITIPATAALGETRLRVVMRYNAAPDACGTFNYGEVEDYTVNIVDDGTPPPPPPPTETFENTNSFSIPDNNTTGVSSPISVTRSGESGTVSVTVNITHTYKGDLIVDLIHPDSTVYNLHNRTGGSANNINETYSVAVGTKDSAGAWELRVSDRARVDIGTIDSWSITF
jgi:choice-of-anchor B domain-containing protein